jgi:hypothetical protein
VIARDNLKRRVIHATDISDGRITLINVCPAFAAEWAREQNLQQQEGDQQGQSSAPGEVGGSGQATS